MNNFTIEELDLDRFKQLFNSGITDFIENNFELINRLRIIFEISRGKYHSSFKKKWGKDHFEICFYVLVLFFETATRFGHKVDFAYVNPALWLFDSHYFKNGLSNSQNDLRGKYNKLESNFISLLDQDSITPFKDESNYIESFEYASIKKSKINVVLLCPNPYSIYSLATIELLTRQGIIVKGVIIKNIFSFSRFKSEFKFGGKRFLKKVWRKLIVRKSENCSSNGLDLPTFLKNNEIPKSSLYTWCKKYKITVITVDDYNDKKSVNFIKNKDTDVVVFTGGGLIKQELLAAPEIGVLNCHMGPLPSYKGMDVVQWPILENAFNQIGLCVHLMVKDIDAGPVLCNKLIPIEKFKTLHELRNYMELLMPQFLTESVVALKNGAIAQEQAKGGRTYFRMHPILEKRVLQLSIKN